VVEKSSLSTSRFAWRLISGASEHRTENESNTATAARPAAVRAGRD